MSSNLFKSYYLNRNTDNARVIDSNEMIAQKLERMRMVMPQANSAGGGFEAVNLFPTGQSEDPADLLSAEAFPEQGEANSSSVIKASDYAGQVYSGPGPEEIIARAKQEAQEEIAAMRASAQQELEAERVSAIQSAQASGYEEGRRLAMQEAEAARQEIENARQELEKERIRLQKEYEKQIDELEPLFVKTLTEIYEKVFEVGLENQQQIVVNLLRNTMKKLEGCRNFLIHVSVADYPYVKEHRKELLSGSTQEGTVIDIVEDSMIREHECTIETINGIYDCGIGTQLKELNKKLTLLSYDGHQES